MNSQGTKLLNAVEKGDIDTVKRLIEENKVPVDYNPYGKTPLILASRNGKLDIVKYLIAKGANIEAMDNNDWTPVLAASYECHLNVVKYLVEHGATPDPIDAYFRTPLTFAADRNCKELIKYLIEKNVDWSLIKNKPIFIEILNEEINKLKTELTKNYLSLERSTPQININSGPKLRRTKLSPEQNKTEQNRPTKSLIPRNLLLKMVYEKPYRELCSSATENIPPIQLIALANILKLDYDLDISWINLCEKIKHALYLLL